MRSASLLFIFLFVSGFSVLSVNAQACGRYYVSVSVQGLDGKPVKNALVKLEPITVDETKGEQFAPDRADPSSFSVSFSEGHSLSEFHQIVVKAAGYAQAKNEIKVFSCQGKSISVKLAPKGSASPAVWEFSNEVYVDVIDANEDHIETATLSVTAHKGKPVSEEVRYGIAVFQLPGGKYTFRIQAPGYLDKEIDVDLTQIANFDLRVKLMPEGTQP
jgi:hypothetical protein